MDRKTFYFILWVADHLKLSQTKINLMAIANLTHDDMKEYLRLCEDYNTLKLDEAVKELTFNEQANLSLTVDIIKMKEEIAKG